MLTVDPVVGRYAVSVDDTAAVERLLKVSNSLGRLPLIAGVGVVLLLVGAALRSALWARRGLAVLLAFALCGGAVYIGKPLVRRPRPWAAAEGLAWRQTVREWQWSGDGRAHSFPSGDVTCAAGLAAVGFLAVGRGRARYLFLLIPLLSATGRILDARHYPSDCLAGLLIGFGVAALVWRVLRARNGDGGTGTATADGP
jgi:membrane-associated phospholipid phosphatase